MWRSVSVCAVLLATTPAHAEVSRWPKPAAGASASGDPELLLTFDDGPHERWTPPILDELDRRGLTAVFFWVGHRVSRPRRQLDARRELVGRAVSRGHLVANHTVNHAQLCQVPRAVAAREIDDSARMLSELAGMPVRMFRAPYGARCRRLLAMLDERDLDHLHWDIDPREWELHDSKAAAAHVIKRLRRLEGRAVLLMHDTKGATVRALPVILDWIVAENARRLDRGERPIRVISYADLARERLAPGLTDWLEGIGRGTSGAGQAIADLIPGRDGTKLSQRE